jgi:molecular chaperone DnaJ
MAEQKRDYYEVLGVAPDADARAIKDAFRKLALKYHPDRSREPQAEERFKEIAEAYAVLSDPGKREEYDARGRAFDPLAGMDLRDLFGDFDLDLGSGGWFERLFGRRAPAVRGRDLELHVEVPLDRILHGGEHEVRFARAGPCAACNGSGVRPGAKPRSCPTCGGRGERVQFSERGDLHVRQISTCRACGGRGVQPQDLCATCAGSGRTSQEEVLRLRIPPGAEEGHVLRIEGKGRPADQADRPPGDLLVVLRTAPHPRFTRDGPHLWCEQGIELTHAVLGTELDVSTLDGPVRARVMPATQPDTVLRLAGLGLPLRGGEQRGDLYVRLKLHVPERLSREQRKLYERLRQLDT